MNSENKELEINSKEDSEQIETGEESQKTENFEQIEQIVVSQTPSKRELKKLSKKQRKAEKKQKYPDKIAFLLGVIVLVFALIGIVSVVWYIAGSINGTSEKSSEYAKYNSFLEPVVAVDPDAFDDISAAKEDQLINAALWSILSKDTTPDTYSYSNGYLLIPKDDVKSAYAALFGNQAANSIEHQTVQGYNTVFEFDSTAGVYKIPITTISPIYTPQVVDVEKSGTALLVTVEYLAAESWAKDDEGNMIAPEPDKTVKITLRDDGGVYYISAIQVLSSTLPEIIIQEDMTRPNEQNTEQSSENNEQTQNETTTLQIPEKSTLGGRL